MKIDFMSDMDSYIKYENAIFISGNKGVDAESNIVQRQGALYDNFGRLVFDSLRRSENAAVKHIAESYIYLTNKKKVFFEPCVYIGHFHGHFGHFLIETLPEIYFASKLGIKIAISPFLDQTLENSFRSEISKSCLSWLDINMDNFVFLESDSILKTVYIKPKLVGINDFIHDSCKECYDFIKSMCISDLVSDRKIYFSRSKISQRRSNADLDELFLKHGFEVLHPQEMSFKDQVSKISDAKVIVGYDGSAMHLSAFMPPGKVYVIDSRNNKNILLINNLIGHETIYIDSDDIVNFINDFKSFY